MSKKSRRNRPTTHLGTHGIFTLRPPVKPPTPPENPLEPPTDKPQSSKSPISNSLNVKPAGVGTVKDVRVVIKHK